MPNLTLRGCCIGTGRPKVIIPIVERTRIGDFEKGRRVFHIESGLCGMAGRLVRRRFRCRMLWRIACMGSGLPWAKSCCWSHSAPRLRAAKSRCAQEEYAAFCTTVCASGCADLLDIEFFPNRKALPALIAQAHAAGVAVVCSSHDFEKTPPKEELVRRMTAMQQAGADLPKLAVMPRSRADVLELLAATAEMTDLPPGNARHHHEHGGAGRGEPPVRRGLRLRHDLCQPRHGQRPWPGAAGRGQRRAGQPGTLI